MNKDAVLARSLPDLTATFSQQILNLRGSYTSWVNKHGVNVEMFPVVKSLRLNDFAYRVTIDSTSLIHVQKSAFQKERAILGILNTTRTAGTVSLLSSVRTKAYGTSRFASCLNKRCR